MTITRQSQQIFLVSKNKSICLWYQQLTHASYACVVKVVKLVDNYSLEQEDKKNDPAEMIFNSNNSNMSDYLDLEITPAENLTKIRLTIIPQQTRVRDMDTSNKLCAPYIGNKLTWIMRYNKGMTAITNKLEELHIDLRGLFDPSSFPKGTSTAILI